MFATHTELDARSTVFDPTAVRLRRFAAVLTAAISVLYVLIGTGAVTVVEDAAGNPDRDTQAAFGFTAAAVFAIGAVVVLYVRRRILWWLGAAAQAFIIYTYFELAPDRVPNFEFWGVLIRALQIVLIGVLVTLGTRRTPKGTTIAR